MIITVKYTGQAGPRERGNPKRRRFPPHPNPLSHRDGGEGEWFRAFRVVRGLFTGWPLRCQGYNARNGNWSTHNYYHADGNGNITYLMTAGEGLAASYRYDAFGNLVGASGSLAGANVYRFSSKEWHERSGLYCYGYRFYVPKWQRWPNRDPIGERGGVNLYGFVHNDPANHWDDFGLLAGAPLPAPPSTLPLPPILTPKPGPPPVLACTLTFCCFYVGTAYVCEKTGFHDWLGGKLCPVKEKKYKTEKRAKTRDWVDPETGRRFCKFRCEYSEETIMREGDDCNKDRIYRVVPDN